MAFVDTFGPPSNNLLAVFCSQIKTFAWKVSNLKQSFVMGVFLCTTAMEDQDFFLIRFGFKASSCREFLLFSCFYSQPCGAVEKNIEVNFFQCIVGF